jgi:large subunit ribosomal protein L5
MIENKMQNIEIEKVILNCGAVGDKLDGSVKLLGKITNRKVFTTTSTKRIPGFGISPGKKSGCKVTIRNKEEMVSLLKKLFFAVENKISIKKIAENHFSFGIKEYIEIPGLEYDRDIGMLGLDITVVFKRKGKRVMLKKIKQGKYPVKQRVTKEEIVEYIKKNLGVKVI